jgi:5-methylcytosine-specific restriction endonuclease McrA
MVAALAFADRMTQRIRGRAGQRLNRLVIHRDHGICWLCGLPGADTVDHIVGLADGGTNQLDNLRAAHLSCNCSRAAHRTNAIRRAERAAFYL